MKKHLLIIALLTLTVTINAQSIFGAKAGLNVSSLTKVDNVSARVRPLIGFYGIYQITDIYALQAEILYSWQGANCNIEQELGNKYAKVSIDYLKIPVLFKYNVWDKLSVDAGISFNLLMSAKESYGSDSYGIKGLNGLDISVPLSVSYVLWSKVDLSMRYDISLSDMNWGSRRGIYNTNLSISVGYRF